MAAITLFLIFALVSKEIAAWTVDLPEARKYFFEKNEKHEQKRKDDSEKVVYANVSSVNKTDFDNIRADSPANTKDKYFDDNYRREEYTYSRPEMAEDSNGSSEENDVSPGRYADEYGYQNYMEKKVANIVHNGTVYLEGLRRALEQYGELLKNCSGNNSSRSTSFSSSSSPNTSNSDSSSFPSPSTPSPSLSTPSSSPSSALPFPSPASSTWLPENLSPESSRSESEEERCERATRESEHVRRLAALALWATRELQDKAYSDKYQKELDEQQEEEEKELLLRLAWFLDRLAFFTGYEPNAEDFISPSTQRTTTVSGSELSVPAILNGNAALTLLQPVATRDQTNAMMNCLSQESDQPAADRCRFPLQMPEEIRRMMSLDDGASVAVSRTARSDSIDSIEALEEAESSDPMRAKSVKKRSINDSPLMTIMQYYGKHKAWTNSNQESKTSDESAESFEQNHLNARKIQKRAIDGKKSTIHNHIVRQEDPMQDISQLLKHKSGVHYVDDESESEKIKMYLDKIRHSDKSSAKALIKRFQKRFKSVKKRSVRYESKAQPARAQDPQQDISYYVKNRRGTNFSYNQVQARQVRAGLEQVFQTGNIEVVRRFGSNYNPAVPNPLLAGALRTVEDF